MKLPILLYILKSIVYKRKDVGHVAEWLKAPGLSLGVF